MLAMSRALYFLYARIFPASLTVETPSTTVITDPVQRVVSSSARVTRRQQSLPATTGGG